MLLNFVPYLYCKNTLIHNGFGEYCQLVGGYLLLLVGFAVGFPVFEKLHFKIYLQS